MVLHSKQLFLPILRSDGVVLKGISDHLLELSFSNILASIRAEVAKYEIETEASYISTGGGMFLEVLEGKTLPAIEVLAKRAAG